MGARAGRGGAALGALRSPWRDRPARSGKTVFVASLVHNLLAGNALPFFEPFAQKRILKVYLEPQPDDAVPRFDHEGNLAKLTGPSPEWPEGTRHISELRLTLEFSPTAMIRRALGSGRCISTSWIIQASGSSIFRSWS